MNLINVLVKLIVKKQILLIDQIILILNLELLQKQHDIYVTPHPIEIPYYLCVKTSTLMNTIATKQERQNSKHIDNIYGKKDLDHEYWFSVPKEK